MQPLFTAHTHDPVAIRLTFIIFQLTYLPLLVTDLPSNFLKKFMARIFLYLGGFPLFSWLFRCSLSYGEFVNFLMYLVTTPFISILHYSWKERIPLEGRLHYRPLPADLFLEFWIGYAKFPRDLAYWFGLK
jgi:hypothetical protein